MTVHDNFWYLQASFDQYLEHKPRVIKAIFAGGEKIQQVNEVFGLLIYPSPTFFDLFFLLKTEFYFIFLIA